MPTGCKMRAGTRLAPTKYRQSLLVWGVYQAKYYGTGEQKAGRKDY